MSELKWNWAYYPYLDPPKKQKESALKAGYIKVVNKDEADKVLAEKDAEIAELKEQVHDYAQGLYVMQETAEMELRHSNNKRCLAMARWCKSSMDYWYDRIEMEQCPKFKFYERWNKRWLKIAEQFKPNNSTAQ